MDSDEEYYYDRDSPILEGVDQLPAPWGGSESSSILFSEQDNLYYCPSDQSTLVSPYPFHASFIPYVKYILLLNCSVSLVFYGTNLFPFFLNLFWTIFLLHIKYVES